MENEKKNYVDILTIKTDNSVYINGIVSAVIYT